MPAQEGILKSEFAPISIDLEPIKPAWAMSLCRWPIFTNGLAAGGGNSGCGRGSAGKRDGDFGALYVNGGGSELPLVARLLRNVSAGVCCAPLTRIRSPSV